MRLPTNLTSSLVHSLVESTTLHVPYELSTLSHALCSSVENVGRMITRVRCCKILVLLTSCGSRSPLTGSVGKCKMGREKDPVWDHFERTLNQNKTISAKCNYCKTARKADVERLKKHLKSSKPYQESGPSSPISP